MSCNFNIKRLRRIGYATLLITSVLLVWVARLAWLQFVEAFRALPHDPHTLIKQSVIQRERGIVLDDGRGRIVDRKGLPITGSMGNAIIFFPIKTTNSQKLAAKEIAALVNVNFDTLMEKWSKASEPFVLRDQQQKVVPLTIAQKKWLEGRQWLGVRVLPYTDPYPLKELTPHWVGYTIQANPSEWDRKLNRGKAQGWSYIHRSGAYGLEKSFNPLLSGIGPVTFVHYQDASLKPLPGLDVRVRKPDNPYYPLRIVTTADLSLHEPIVKIMKQHGLKKGSVVVMDATNRDVLAMVSVPSYHPEHIDPQDHAWNNIALDAVAPGSVYKLVTAAWALESGKVSRKETFHCDGELGKYGLSCWKKGGHGTLTLEEAFAESCNVAFAELSERMTEEEMYSYAEKLGFIGPVGLVSNDHLGHKALSHFPNEASGRVFSKLEPLIRDQGAKAQSSIGQRDVRITPLAAANAMVTIIKGGVFGHPRLVMRMEDKEGAVISSFAKEAASERRLKARTAHDLRHWMEQVVEQGTGKALRNRAWPLAGKSGTAQAGAYGTKQLHTWFVGYGPANKPRYAVAVVSEDEANDGKHRATAVFGEVMDLLADFDKGL
ncbi:peptidoglycan D,D-transpeptidase FtsI family protein [Paenibacillus sp. 1001270B_150601_E10]|uniref:peptidoglycan D,D-transpeptidase FtsI family protein n=1 Tax=Paenibacillus sp. 1001270B_150601_E10 TaxID=2787079 RepID=UPI00189E82CC|nr:penicillin-binding protein 2 [Paenibacillus sp. 1001270B_150601_E10]